MKQIEKFYQNTKNALPHQLVIDFLDMEHKTGNAIDLGCGAGRDTVFLIKNNWQVLSIDRENTEEQIKEKLSQEEIKRFRFSKQEFENIKLEKADLIVANYSLPFCNKDCFGKLWKQIVNSISKNRIFCWKSFWIKGFLGYYQA